MLRPRITLVAAITALAVPATASASVSTWQSCGIGPAGDTALCTSGGFPHSIISAGGALWAASARGEIIRVSADAGTAGAMTFFGIPAAPTIKPQADVVRVGPDGQLWFTQDDGARIGRMTTAGTFSFLPLTEDAARKVIGARGLTRGPDGAMWVTRYPGATITRIAADGTTTDYPLAGSDLYVALQDIVSGPGDKLWFVRSGQNSIGSITTSGTVAFFHYPLGISYVSQLTEGPDRAIWFTAVTTAAPRRGLVGRLAPDGTYRLFDLGSYIPRAIYSDGDQLWLGSSILPPASGHALLRMTTAGVVTRVEPLLFAPDISDITTGPDGAIWFTDLGGAQIGRVDGKASPTTGAPTPVAIEPGSLALTDSGASVTLDAEADADVDLRTGLPATAATASALKVRGAKRVVVPVTRTVGKAKTRITKGQKLRVAVRLSAATRRAIRRGARVQVAIRATDSSKRKTVVQATMRVR